jgi:hypothetical protein
VRFTSLRGARAICHDEPVAHTVVIGELNWCLPTWLGWLPTLDHERSVDSPVIDAEPVRLAA